MADVIIGNGNRAELPKAKTVGEAANTLASEQGIAGGQFTLKVNGDVLAPTAALKADDTDVLELVECVDEPTTPEPRFNVAEDMPTA